MSTKTTKQQLPKWFRGEVYKEGATVRNRFSGEEYKLNNIELSMYDFIIGSTMVMEMAGGWQHTDVQELRKGLDWFRKHNAKAYMVLLDQSMELTMTDDIMLEIHYVIIAYIIFFILGIIGTKKRKIK